MKKVLRALTLVAVLGSFSLNVYAQSLSDEVSTPPSEEDGGFFERKHHVGTCVDGIREEWDTFWGFYIPGSLTQWGC